MAKTDETGNRLKSAAELQDQIEKERAWIRTRNAKIYDNKIAMLAHYSNDGREILKREIQDSEARLQQVKSGVHLIELIPKDDPTYFLTDKEPYFTGINKQLRKLEKNT